MQVNTTKGFGLLYEMGCGKTLTSIAVMGAAYLQDKIKKVLIVAPTSVCSVWPKEFNEYADFKFKVNVLLGDKKKRLQALTELDNFPFPSLKVAVINYESTWRLIDELKAWQPDMIIADESQRIKTHDASQSKAMHELGDMAKYKLILSGTPVQNNAIDLFSQYRFLDKTIFGTNFYTFRSKYTIMGGFNKYQIIGYRDLDHLIQKAHSIAYRVTKDEALDLPEQTFETWNVELNPEERKLYDRIKKEQFAEIEGSGHITAATVLTKMLRLQQITGGFVQLDEATGPQQIGKGKLDALEEIIEDYVIDCGKKLVVFARFIPEIKAICKLVESKKLKYSAIWGDVKLEDRGQQVKQFQEDPNVMVFVAQIQTAGLGITLTAANTAVYYSLDFNYANYSQSLSRIHRIGQRNACTYINLTVPKTIDEQVLKALEKKEDLAKSIVDDWKQYF